MANCLRPTAFSRRKSKMKKILLSFAFVCAALVFSLSANAQNLTTISASNIQDINGTKLASGQLCFLITDQQDNPISVSIGGGGQVLKRGYCSPVTAGVVTTFTVPNPANTLPSGIYYRVTVKDSGSGLEVLRYTQVSFTGATFNFDNYAPLNLGTPAPLSGNSVTGNLSVTGNVAATGTVTGTNIPSSILQQIFNAGTGLTQRTAFNMLAGVTCADNPGTARTDCRAGGLTAVTFSATPTFDASTNSMFKLTLTGNVTSSTLSNAIAGQQLSFEICQDATGGRTFVQPGNVQGWITPSTAASTCTLQAFWFDGTNAQPDLEPPITGDVTQSAGSTVATVTKVNGVSYLAGPSTHQIPIVTAANTASYKTLPDCQDSTGNHINYTQSTDAFTCGTSVPANTVTTTGTQTLTNKTLGGTTPVNRLRANQGTPVVVGDWTITGLGAGIGSWGTTASISSVSGTDMAGSILITCSGTGQTVNPGFKLTFHDGAFPSAPIGIGARGDGNSPAVPIFTLGASTTTVAFGLGGVCVAGTTYVFYYSVI
jgi:hypothetical protein